MDPMNRKTFTLWVMILGVGLTLWGFKGSLAFAELDQPVRDAIEKESNPALRQEMENIARDIDSGKETIREVKEVVAKEEHPETARESVPEQASPAGGGAPEASKETPAPETTKEAPAAVAQETQPDAVATAADNADLCATDPDHYQHNPDTGTCELITSN